MHEGGALSAAVEEAKTAEKPRRLQGFSAVKAVLRQLLVDFSQAPVRYFSALKL